VFGGGLAFSGGGGAWDGLVHGALHVVKKGIAEDTAGTLAIQCE